jgi:two-component system, HptB-dependent secretion and biofilm response regulator
MPSILIFKQEKLHSIFKSCDLALGINDDDLVVGSHKKLGLQAGDRIFAYSDGVVEATNPQNEMFGEERLIATLSEMIEQKQELSNLKKSLNLFRNSSECDDDITIVDIKL